jgi:hypothetical protein
MRSVGTNLIINDCPDERLSLPCMRDTKLKGGTFLSILKDLVGKDITKFSMPVVVNEPLSNLQKMCEFLAFNDLIERALL